MLKTLSKLWGRRGNAEQVPPAGPMPLCNVFRDGAPFAWLSDYCRFNIFEALSVHDHSNEDGFLLVVSGRPEMQISEEKHVAKPGEIFPFALDQLHGFNGHAKIAAFHGFAPLQEDGYRVLEATRTPHPDGGENTVVVIQEEGEREPERFTWGPDINMTPGAARREVAGLVKKRREP